MKNIVVELAGRDSFVALYRFLKENPDEKFVFHLSIVKTPPENINQEKQIWMVRKIESYLRWIGHNTTSSFDIDDDYNDIWYSMLKKEFTIKFNSSTYLVSPCILCHTFCHLMRFSMAIYTMSDIITGERLSHDGKLKANQTSDYFHLMDKFASKYRIKFIRPLLNEDNSKTIQKEYKEFLDLIRVREDEYTFTPCALSGSSKVRSNKELEGTMARFMNIHYSSLDEIFKEIHKKSVYYTTNGGNYKFEEC